MSRMSTDCPARRARSLVVSSALAAGSMPGERGEPRGRLLSIPPPPPLAREETEMDPTTKCPKNPNRVHVLRGDGTLAACLVAPRNPHLHPRFQTLLAALALPTLAEVGPECEPEEPREEESDCEYCGGTGLCEVDKWSSRGENHYTAEEPCGCEAGRKIEADRAAAYADRADEKNDEDAVRAHRRGRRTK